METEPKQELGNLNSNSKFNQVVSATDNSIIAEGQPVVPSTLPLRAEQQKNRKFLKIGCCVLCFAVVIAALLVFIISRGRIDLPSETDDYFI